VSNTVFCSIHSLDISIPVRFNSEEIKDLIIPVVSERISVIRLPHYEWENSPSYPCSHEVSINAEADKEELLVEFSCQAFKGSYKVIIDGFHWDFWKALIASFSHALSDKNIMIAHAACVEINGESILLPGNSGDGKSSLSYECLNQGVPVYASELCYIQGTKFLAGNLAASIDKAALDYFDISIPKNASYKEGRVLTDTNSLLKPHNIRKIYFPKVNCSLFRLREITARRARMLLYENVVGQLSSSQLLCHNSIPIFPLPTEAHVSQIAKQVSALITEPTYIVEGHPSRILKWMKENG